MGIKSNRHIDACKPGKYADRKNNDHLLNENMIDAATENLICLINNIEVKHQVVFKSTTLKVDYGDNSCAGEVLGGMQRECVK